LKTAIQLVLPFGEEEVFQNQLDLGEVVVSTYVEPSPYWMEFGAWKVLSTNPQENIQ
jgi:hypothetical protein